MEDTSTPLDGIGLKYVPMEVLSVCDLTNPGSIYDIPLSRPDLLDAIAFHLRMVHEFSQSQKNLETLLSQFQKGQVIPWPHTDNYWMI